MKKLVCILIALVLVVTLAAPAYADYDPSIDYMSIMIDAAVSGDVERGTVAEACREEKRLALGLDSIYPKVAFEDLYWLAKIMDKEAGDCSDDTCPLGVGEVVLNRVESPEWDFPDTVMGVLYAPGQYSGVNGAKFINLKPRERCVLLALRLLEGERHMHPSVVFQDNSKHGSGVYVSYKHAGHSTLYFCVSSYPWLYE